MGIRIYGNRLLQTLPGLVTRPTSSRVRTAVFNSLHDQVSGSRWLDLCAGAGTIGAEALCRGASLVVGIEQSRAACRVIQANWRKVATFDQTYQVIQSEARRALKRGLVQQVFDYVYLDPPYESEWYEQCLLLMEPLVHSSSLIMAEHRRSEPLQPLIGSLTQLECRVYGETGLTLYQLVS